MRVNPRVRMPVRRNGTTSEGYAWPDTAFPCTAAVPQGGLHSSACRAGHRHDRLGHRLWRDRVVRPSDNRGCDGGSHFEVEESLTKRTSPASRARGWPISLSSSGSFGNKHPGTDFGKTVAYVGNQRRPRPRLSPCSFVCEIINPVRRRGTAPPVLPLIHAGKTISTEPSRPSTITPT